MNKQQLIVHEQIDDIDNLSDDNANTIISKHIETSAIREFRNYVEQYPITYNGSQLANSSFDILVDWGCITLAKYFRQWLQE